jgi:eukaryotic-like serine/threonine-protein kinase
VGGLQGFSMTLEKNTLLHNRYRIIEILGQGGMGSVYRAVDENLGVHIALKENLFTTDEYARQFRLEAVILANLRHPNLPRVSDHIVLGDQGQYLVMDFIEGEDLRNRMERVGMLTDEEAVHIGAAICDALAYLHSRKPPILHRDIKPGNVKITPDGHIFLVDFGLAKVYQSDGQATTTGARAMTPGYSPPEQYGTARTDPRTDIYSLGATLYAALTGIIPEDGLARAMDNAQLTPLRRRNSKVSRRLSAVIEKAMSVDPSDRYQTAEEFKKVLLVSKAKTQKIPGTYTVLPPPPDVIETDSLEHAPVRNEPEASAKASKPRGPLPPKPHPHEDQPFVSPLKRQKERERQRRRALIRFAMTTLLLFLTLGSVIYFVPGVLPAEVRAMIPLGAPTATDTPEPSATPSPLPTHTLAPTETAVPTEPPPTFTPAPTNTFIPGVGETPSPPVTITLVPSSSFPGGGSGQVAFASMRDGLPQIYLADLNGETVQLTDMSNGACQPAWSPDGQRLVFISPCRELDDLSSYRNASLYIMNADGSGLVGLESSPGGNFDPAWSPDGTKIAFTSLRTGQMEIFTVEVGDLITVKQITSNQPLVESRMPVWSPDGSKFVYVVKRFGVHQIWMMNADGTEQTQIVRSGTAFHDYLPSWSPKGDLVLFTQRCATTFCNPYLMNISASDRSGEQARRVRFSGLQFIQGARYSPDGFYLAYEGVADVGNLDIFYMTVSGGERVRITTDKAQDFHVVWRPIIREP